MSKALAVHPEDSSSFWILIMYRTLSSNVRPTKTHSFASTLCCLASNSRKSYLNGLFLSNVFFCTISAFLFHLKIPPKNVFLFWSLIDLRSIYAVFRYCDLCLWSKILWIYPRYVCHQAGCYFHFIKKASTFYQNQFTLWIWKSWLELLP